VTCSENCSSSAALAALLCACAAAPPRHPPPALPGLVAVLPPSNLSGAAAPIKEVRAALESALRRRGVPLVEPEQVEQFLARHRIRWTGGIDSQSSGAAARELGASAVLVVALDSYQDTFPPRFGMRARLVEAGSDPRIAGGDARGRAGDESPGLFDLGIVSEVKELQQDVIEQVAGSLAGYLSGKTPHATACAAGCRFEPQASYRSLLLEGDTRASVAILPLVNETQRRYAGDLIALDFLRLLEASGRFRAVEPGLLRDEILRFRMVADEGISLDTARVLLELLDADYVLAGTVRDYEDPASAAGAPKVQFSAMLLDRKNNEVVWQSSSYHRGDDGVFFFDAGHVGTAASLSCRMVQSTLERLLEGASRGAQAQKVHPAPLR
jgi:TolB-like protein